MPRLFFLNLPYDLPVGSAFAQTKLCLLPTKCSTVILCFSLLMTLIAHGQSVMPDTYKALQVQLENQPDSVQIERWADFIGATVERGRFMEAASASQAMMTIAKRTNNSVFLGRAYTSAGYIAQNEGNPTLAIVNYQRAGTIYQAKNEWHRQVTASERIGWVYINVRNLPLAESYFTKAMTLARQHNLTGDIVNLYADLATVYDIRKQFDKALSFNAQCIRLAKSTGAYYLGALLNRGIILKNAGRYPESLTTYQQVLRLAEKQREVWVKYVVYENMSNTLLLMNRLDEAERYIRLTLQVARKLPQSQYVLQELYETLTAIYERRGQYRQALTYHKQWVVHRDSVFNAEKSRQLVEAETRFQSREKQQQIQHLDENNLRQQQQLRLLGGGMLLLVFLLGTMVWQYRALGQSNQRVNRTLNELKRTQDQLIQQEKMASLGELTAGIAHEIQNPLNFVNNFSEISSELAEELKQGPFQHLPDSEKEYAVEILSDLTQNLQKITHHGSRASSIVRGMLEHSRTGTGKMQPTDLNALTDEYLRLAYHGLRAKDKDFTCALVTEFDPTLGRVTVVAQDMGRVLLNLFTNAFHAVKERQKLGIADYQPTVTVSTHKAKAGIQIRVADNGTGIAAGVQQKVFQPFFTTKPPGEGTGLGLSLSYDIVTKEHGGSLTVQSQQGEGTEFTIELPVPKLVAKSEV